jgi:hypothetical protein
MKHNLKTRKSCILKGYEFIRKIHIPELFSVFIYSIIFLITSFMFKKEIFIFKFIVSFIIFSVYCVFKKIVYQYQNSDF